MKIADAAPRPRITWTNILFFAFTTLTAAAGVPFCLLQGGFSPFIAGLTSFYVLATGLSITVGYHRCFAHVTYKAHPALRFIFLFFGAAAFEQSALRWASQHRDHHRYLDTERDPYSVKKGFFHAHIGWLMFWEQVERFENAADLQKDKVLMSQHHHYKSWAIVSGVLLPVLLGALNGQAIEAFIFAVCGRLVLVQHGTFCVNSICHKFGKKNYDADSTARDSWFVAVLTSGEGYHSFHHRFPGDYRHGVRWYDWDPGKWLIAALSFLGLTSDLRKVSKTRIDEARFSAKRPENKMRMSELKTAFDFSQPVRAEQEISR